jgi:hypothetical protein
VQDRRGHADPDHEHEGSDHALSRRSKAASRAAIRTRTAKDVFPVGNGVGVARHQPIQAGGDCRIDLGHLSTSLIRSRSVRNAAVRVGPTVLTSIPTAAAMAS